MDAGFIADDSRLSREEGRNRGGMVTVSQHASGDVQAVWGAQINREELFFFRKTRQRELPGPVLGAGDSARVSGCLTHHRLEMGEETKGGQKKRSEARFNLEVARLTAERGGEEHRVVSDELS